MVNFLDNGKSDKGKKASAQRDTFDRCVGGAD